MTSIPQARRLAIASALLLCLCNISQALPVFPGAVGYGSQTIAGRNAAAADIYEVTTLADDSYTSPSVGTLRYGIEKIARPRVIVFRVSGVIELRRDLMVRMNDAAGDHGYLTIAGQTAPYPGITLKNGGIRVMSHDVLIQHIAVRPGNTENTSSGWDLTTLDNRDCIRVETSGTAIANNIVVDHISCSWSTDEAVSMWSETGTVSNVTFSNSMLGDPIQFAGHAKGQHGYGPLVGAGTSNVTLVRNVMAFNWSRNPLIRDRTSGAQVVNNFIYHPGPSHNAAMRVGSYGGQGDPDKPQYPNYPATVSAIGNIVIRNPSTVWHGATRTYNGRVGFYIDAQATTQLGLFLDNNHVFSPMTNAWYPTDGNPYHTDVYTAITTPANIYGADPHAGSGGFSWPVLTGNAATIEAKVVPDAGKFSGMPDTIDTLLTTKISGRTGTWLEYFTDLGTDPWAPVNQQSNVPLTIPANPTADSDSDGYTNLEEWLHARAAAVEGRIAAPIDAAVNVSDNFSDGNSDGWDTATTDATGSWSISSGALRQSLTNWNGRAVLAKTHWTDQVIQATVTPTAWGGSGFVAVYGRYRTLNDTYYMTLRSTKIIELKRIKTNPNGSTSVTVYGTVNLPASFDLTVPHTLRLEISGYTLKGYLDGTLQFTGTDSEAQFASGRTAVGTYLAAAAFDNVFASAVPTAVP
jgi:hypothetical protein